MRRGPSPSPRSSCYSSEPQARRSRSCITFSRSENRCEPSKRARPTKPCSSICSVVSLADRAFHLQLDQAVQLDGVLKRKLLGYRLDKAVDDHRDGLFLGEPAAHQVEELVLTDLRDGSFVLGVDLLLLDLDVRISICPGFLVKEQRVALDPALGVDRAFVHLQEHAVRATARPLGDGFGGDEAGSVRRGMDDLAAGVLVLSVAGVGHGENLTPRALAHKVDRRVLHREPGTEVAVDPLDGRVLVGRAPLGDEVVGVVRPVLDGRVPYPRARLGDKLHDRRMKRVRSIRRGRAALDVVDVGVLVGDDERPLELAHVLSVDPEVRLKRDIHANAGRDVHERAARPHGRVQRCELVVVRRDDGPEVLLNDVLMLAQARVHVQEDDALFLELFLQRVVDDLGLVLRANAGERLSLSLRDAQLLERVLDVVGHIVPGAALILHRLDVVVDVVVVHLREVAAPGGGRLLEERLQRLQPELQHPLRLVLVLGDHGDDLRVYTLPRGPEEVLLRVAEAVLVLVEPEFVNGLVFRHSLVPSLALRPGAELLAHPVIALLFQIVGELLATRGHEPPVQHHVDPVRLDVPEYPLVVGDDDRRELRPLHLVDTLRHDLQGVNVQARVSLVHDGEFGVEHEHLQDLVPLFLAAGEALVEVPLGEPRVHLHDAHLLLEEPVHLHRRKLILAHGVDRGPEEVGHGDARYLARVLECEEHAELGPLVRLQLEDVLALERYGAFGHLVTRMAHEHVGERALPRAVRAHDRVYLTLANLEIQALHYLLTADLYLKIFYLEHQTPATRPCKNFATAELFNHSALPLTT